MVKFRTDKSTYGDESIPLEYLLGEGYHGYFFQKADQQLIAALSRRERREISARVLLSKKNAEDTIEHMTIRSREKRRCQGMQTDTHESPSDTDQAAIYEKQRRRFLQILPGQLQPVKASVDDAVRKWRVSRARSDQRMQQPRYVYPVIRHRTEAVRKNALIAQVRNFVSHSKERKAQSVRDERRLALEVIEASNLRYAEAVRVRTRGLKDKEAAHGTQELLNDGTRHQRAPRLRHGSEQLVSKGRSSWGPPSTQTLLLDSTKPITRRTERVLGGGYRVTVPSAVMLQHFSYGGATGAEGVDSLDLSDSPRSVAIRPHELRLVGCTALKNPPGRLHRSQTVRSKTTEGHKGPKGEEHVNASPDRCVDIDNTVHGASAHEARQQQDTPTDIPAD